MEVVLAVRFASVCSGIGAPEVAWRELGWKCAWQAEVAPFPSAVLAQRFPGVENLGDITKIDAGRISGRKAVDLLVGGTPCQSFSVAGLREGLRDPRGNLALEYLRVASLLGCRWIVWENVPGVLSSNQGRDFGAFLGALEKLGYGWAYRVLDAQFFGVPQRRRRVFVVGHLGDWRRAAAVLFERESLRGDSPKGGKTREEVAALTATGVGTCGADDNQAQAGHLVARALTSHHGRIDGESENFIAHTLRAPPTLRAMGFTDSHVNGGGQVAVQTPGFVRRITPREAERLQGFPDDWTLIEYRGKPAKDGPRYQSVGNSMAVPVLRWLGEKIAMVETL